MSWSVSFESCTLQSDNESTWWRTWKPTCLLAKISFCKVFNLSLSWISRSKTSYLRFLFFWRIAWMRESAFAKMDFWICSQLHATCSFSSSMCLSKEDSAEIFSSTSIFFWVVLKQLLTLSLNPTTLNLDESTTDKRHTAWHHSLFVGKTKHRVSDGLGKNQTWIGFPYSQKLLLPVVAAAVEFPAGSSSEQAEGFQQRTC